MTGHKSWNRSDHVGRPVKVSIGIGNSKRRFTPLKQNLNEHQCRCLIQQSLLVTLVPESHRVRIELAKSRPVRRNFLSILRSEVCEEIEVMGSTDHAARQDDPALEELLAGLLRQKADRLGRSTPALDKQGAGQVITTARLEQLPSLGSRSWAHGLGASNNTRPLLTAL